MRLYDLPFHGQAVQENVEISNGTLATSHGLNGHGIAEKFALQ